MATLLLFSVRSRIPLGAGDPTPCSGSSGSIPVRSVIERGRARHGPRLTHPPT